MRLVEVEMERALLMDILSFCAHTNLVSLFPLLVAFSNH